VLKLRVEKSGENHEVLINHVTKKIRYTLRLELPESIGVHDVFSPNKLYKNPNNPLEGQVNNSLPLIIIIRQKE
jgi:hypothetical protein